MLTRTHDRSAREVMVRSSEDRDVTLSGVWTPVWFWRAHQYTSHENRGTFNALRVPVDRNPGKNMSSHPGAPRSSRCNWMLNWSLSHSGLVTIFCVYLSLAASTMSRPRGEKDSTGMNAKLMTPCVKTPVPDSLRKSSEMSNFQVSNEGRCLTAVSSAWQIFLDLSLGRQCRSPRRPSVLAAYNMSDMCTAMSTSTHQSFFQHASVLEHSLRRLGDQSLPAHQSRQECSYYRFRIAPISEAI